MCIRDRVNERINTHRRDTGVSAIDTYELDLFLSALQKDLLSYKETHSAKQFELWTLTRENEEKSNEREELSRKLMTESANLEVNFVQCAFPSKKH